jgi:predicted transcriptional regulator
MLSTRLEAERLGITVAAVKWARRKIDLEPDTMVRCRDGRLHPARRANTADRDAVVREYIREGMTQREVGEVVGLSQSQVSRIVRRSHLRANQSS